MTFGRSGTLEYTALVDLTGTGMEAACFRMRRTTDGAM